MAEPRYPQIHVEVRSPNPLALVAAVRYALRRAKVERSEIRRFTNEAFAFAGRIPARRICARWVDVG